MTDLKKNYIISSGFAESGRLYLQQWLWKMQLGWDLHPSIKLPKDGEIRIADQGCGNGAWLLSLATGFDEAYRSRASMTGFDISSFHFPAAENLPENVTLKILDGFTGSLPDSLIGKFDVVHVRVFTSVVKNNNPGPLIYNVVKMLKPGGYFQWDEMDSDTLQAVPPSPSASLAATQEMLDTALVSSKKGMHLEYSWVSNLGTIFERHGLEVIEDRRMKVKKELRKAYTDSLLMAFDHIGRLAVKDGRMVGTEKNWTELWDKAGAEVAKGVSVTMDMLVRVGRKCA